MSSPMGVFSTVTGIVMNERYFRERDMLMYGGDGVRLELANAVVQTVHVTDAAFPVIADPTWTVGGAIAVIPSIRGGAAGVCLNKKLSQVFVEGGATACAVVVTSTHE